MPRIFFDDELHLIRLVYNIVQATQKIMRCLQRENQNTHRVKTKARILTVSKQKVWPKILNNAKNIFWWWIAFH